jgi:outer membrane protein assembly factor BamB
MIRSAKVIAIQDLTLADSLTRKWSRLLLILTIIVLGGACGRANFDQDPFSGMALWEENEDSVLYVGSGEGRLLAISLPDEQLLWIYPETDQTPLGPVYSPPAITTDLLYLATANDNRDIENKKIDRGVLYAFDHQECAKNPQRCIDSWSFPDSRALGELGHEVGPLIGGPVVEGETVVVGSSDGSMYAVSATDGTLAWEFPTGDKIWSTPTVVGGIVYFGSLDHTVYAVNLADGYPIWSYETGGAITGTPLVLDGRLYIGSFDGNLYILDTDTGSDVGVIPLGGWIWAGPTVDATKKTVYITTMGGNLYALDRRGLDRGQELEQWLPVPVSGPVLAPPSILNDRILFTDDRGVRMVRLDGRTDRREPCTLSSRVRAAVVPYKDLVYLIDDAHDIWVLDTETCKPNIVFGLGRN